MRQEIDNWVIAFCLGILTVMVGFILGLIIGLVFNSPLAFCSIVVFFPVIVITIAVYFLVFRNKPNVGEIK